MKSTLILLACILTSSHAAAQKIKTDQVPVLVKAVFAKAFPNAKEVKWEKEDQDYEVGFEQSKQDISVLVDVNGVVKEMEIAIGLSELLSSVRLELANHYAEYKVDEASKIVAGAGVTYEAAVKKNGQSFDLIFDPYGKLLKKTVQGKEKKD